MYKIGEVKTDGNNEDFGQLVAKCFVYDSISLCRSSYEDGRAELNGEEY